MQDLIKAQYRNSDLKDNANEITSKVFAMVPVTYLLTNDKILETFCHAVAITIIQNSVKTMQKNIDGMLAKRGKVMDKKDAENIISEMSELFISEMEVAAKVAMLDLKLWANKAVTMGSNQDKINETLQAAWATKTPPLFKDFNSRVKQAITGYVNSTFQMLVISNAA